MEQEQIFELQDSIMDASEEERMEKVKEYFPTLEIKSCKIGTDDRGANKYKVTLTNNNTSYSTVFHDSIYNTYNNTPSSNFAMLHSIIMDALCYDTCINFQDFCYELEYDIEEERSKAEKCYNACKKAYEGIEELVGYKGYEILNAICYNY